ncbi:MAG TPA: hypothetical protein VN903_38675 [Polyangia bacterium]|nr:hypothetical protein [Polyangia bacterium]
MHRRARSRSTGTHAVIGGGRIITAASKAVPASIGADPPPGNSAVQDANADAMPASASPRYTIAASGDEASTHRDADGSPA